MRNLKKLKLSGKSIKVYIKIKAIYCPPVYLAAYVSKRYLCFHEWLIKC